MIYILMIVFTAIPSNFDYSGIPDNTAVLQNGDVAGIPQGQVVFDNEKTCHVAAQRMITNIRNNIQFGPNDPDVTVGCAEIDLTN